MIAYCDCSRGIIDLAQALSADAAEGMTSHERIRGAGRAVVPLCGGFGDDSGHVVLKRLAQTEGRAEDDAALDRHGGDHHPHVQVRSLLDSGSSGQVILRVHCKQNVSCSSHQAVGERHTVGSRDEDEHLLGTSLSRKRLQHVVHICVVVGLSGDRGHKEREKQKHLRHDPGGQTKVLTLWSS